MGFQLVQDVAVAGVDVEGAVVHVGVYGGPENVCASVSFTFVDARERAVNVARLRRWERQGTSLSLVVHGGTVRMFNDRTLFDRGLEAAGA